jgi:hypothetical protein
MEIPVFKIFVDNAGPEGLEAIAVVESPAIVLGYKKFSKESAKQKFNINDERQILSGPLIIAELPIYRREGDYEYYVVFDKDSVERMVIKFFKQSKQLSFNFEHNSKDKLEGVLFESFIVDSRRGILAPTGYDLPDGSWFGSLKIEDKKMWERAKQANFTGFSVEGLFNHELIKTSPEDDLLNKIESLLNE